MRLFSHCQPIIVFSFPRIADVWSILLTQHTSSYVAHVGLTYTAPHSIAPSIYAIASSNASLLSCSQLPVLDVRPTSNLNGSGHVFLMGINQNVKIFLKYGANFFNIFILPLIFVLRFILPI